MIRFSVLISVFLITICHQAQAVDVVVSIKPVHSLVSAVMQGVGEPVLLVKGNASPHQFQLKPSNIRQLNSADLVIFIDSRLEHFLVNSLSNLPDKVKTLELSKQLDLPLLSRRSHQDWAGNLSHGHNHGDNHGHDANQDFPDLHLWLAPEYARDIVNQIADALIKIDRRNTERYVGNREHVLSRLSQLEKQISKELLPVRERPFVVFHDAYQYFEKSFGLKSAGTILLDPGRMPSVATIKRVQNKIRQERVVCVFHEPQYSDRLVKTVTEGLNVRQSSLDPLGVSQEPGADHYFQMMQALSRSITDCLAQ